MKRLMIAVLLMVAFALPGGTRAAVLVLSADPDYLDCSLSDPGPGSEVVVYVLLIVNPGAQAVEFAAPVPANCGLTFLRDVVPPPFLTIGDSQSGVAVVFTSCVAGDAVVIAMHFARTAAGQTCCPYYLAPRPISGLDYVDCNFDSHPMPTQGIVINANASCSDGHVNPSNPLPADEAVDVPVTVELSWDEATYLCGAPNGAGDWDYLWFGTTPAPPAVGYVENPHSVGPLLPETTYYWRVRSGVYTFTGPVWSFTTTGANPVATSTWGRIKALYH